MKKGRVPCWIFWTFNSNPTAIPGYLSPIHKLHYITEDKQESRKDEEMFWPPVPTKLLRGSKQTVVTLGQPSCSPVCHHNIVGNACKLLLKFANWFCSYALLRSRKTEEKKCTEIHTKCVCTSKVCLTTQEASSSLQKNLQTVDRKRVSDLSSRFDMNGWYYLMEML